MMLRFQLGKDAEHLEQGPPCRCPGIERLPVQVKIYASPLKLLQRREQVRQGAAQSRVVIAQVVTTTLVVCMALLSIANGAWALLILVLYQFIAAAFALAWNTDWLTKRT